MRVYHHLVLGRLFQDILVVVHHPLAVMLFASRNDISHVTKFGSIVVVVVHELQCLFQMPFVIAHGSGSFVVHHYLHTFFFRVIAQVRQVEIGIRRYEIENEILGMSEPVFPTYVPTLDENFIKAVLGGKVDVFLHVFGRGPVFAVGLHLGVVGFTDFHARQVVSIRPFAFACYHFPPYAHILDRFYPRRILDFTRFVQVEGYARCKYVAGIVADDDRAPRRLARRLHISLVAHRVRCQPRTEYHVLVIQFKVHTGIIDERGFVQVHVYAVVGLQQQRCLHACR